MTAPIAAVDSAAAACAPEDRLTYATSWYSTRLETYVNIWTTPSGQAVLRDRPRRAEPIWAERLRLLANTLRATRRFSIAAERRAQRRLRALLTREQWRSYVVAGEFFERSRRSSVLYWFRRLRPTIAITMRGNRGGGGVRAALCLHPVGYHHESFAGLLPPSADVLAHLVLMRADEPRFWKTAGHHRLADPRSGV